MGPEAPTVSDAGLRSGERALLAKGGLPQSRILWTAPRPGPRSGRPGSPVDLWILDEETVTPGVSRACAESPRPLAPRNFQAAPHGRAQLTLVVAAHVLPGLCAWPLVKVKKAM